MLYQISKILKPYNYRLRSLKDPGEIQAMQHQEMTGLAL